MICEGRLRLEWATRNSGRNPGLEFFEVLSNKDQAKVGARMLRLAETGALRSPEMFRLLDKAERIFEIKTGNLRFPCFFAPPRAGRQLVIVTHGFAKKSGKTPRGQIDLAISIKFEWLQRLEET